MVVTEAGGTHHTGILSSYFIVHLQDVQEIQKSLKKDVEEVQKQIDCLHIKIQCVNVSASHLFCVQYLCTLSRGVGKL